MIDETCNPCGKTGYRHKSGHTDYSICIGKRDCPTMGPDLKNQHLLHEVSPVDCALALIE